jgi:signal transduction histidine kinase
MPGPDHDTRLVTPFDVLLAVVVGIAQVGFTYLASHHQEAPRGFDGWAVLLLGVSSLALVVRRRYPVAVLAVAFAATFLYAVLGYAHGPVFFSLIVAYVTAVLTGHRQVAWASLVIGYVAFLWGEALGPRAAPSLGAVVGLAAWLFVMAAATELIIARRRQMLDEQRARAAEAQQLRTEERLRIAREVHDVVAHNISLINVQAGVALHLMEEQPDRVAPALAAIKQASRETLDELRSVVDALRGVDEHAPRAPTPGIADVDRLVERTTAAGLPVRLEETGARRALPAGVDLAAYRIVQEALTNATRHAQASSVTVQLRHGEHDLTIQVDDDGRALANRQFWHELDEQFGAPAQQPRHGGNGRGSGSGITGMRERATALGGTFTAGPKPGGGFRVQATLPLDGDS